ncbi:MAG: GntR family transcriptional regulator [Streptosporangiales bacterium]
MTSSAARSQEAGAWEPGRDIVVEYASPIPLYFQVASQLEAAIDSGALPPGARLDNEVSLAERLGLSRPTVRQAIQSLVDKGMVVRKRGVGTQVVLNRVKRPLELSSLYDDLAEIDQKPSTRVLVNEVVGAPAGIAGPLGVPEDTEVSRFVRVRYARGEPIARLENYLPGDVVRPTTAELEARGLYQLLRAAGVRLHAAQQTIGARSATREESDLLEEPKGAPLLTMERSTYSPEGSTVEYGSHVYRASRYSFNVSLRG